MKKVLLTALSLAFFQYGEAQPYLTNMGGTYVKVTDYTQVKDKDIVILASHSTKDGENKVRIMTTVSTDQMGMFGFYTHESYNSIMPESITLQSVNAGGTPYEYAVNYTEQKTKGWLDFSLRDINGKYITATKNSKTTMALSDKEFACSLTGVGSDGNDKLRLDINELLLHCEDRPNEKLSNINGYFHNMAKVNEAEGYNIVYPYRKVHEVSFGADGYSTFYYGSNDVALPAGVKAYTYELQGNILSPSHEFDGGKGDMIPHSTAVILKGEPNTKCILEVKNIQSDNVYGNKLRGTDIDTSTHLEDDADGSKYYLLCNGGNGIGFYYADDSGSAFINAAHKAYLCLSPKVAAKGVLLYLPGLSTPTGIQSCKGMSENPSDDVSDWWHDLTGRRVSKPMKGMYIRDGKIVAVQ